MNKSESFFRGNPGNSSFNDTAFTFPDGLDNCFRCRTGINIDDSFLNAPLEFRNSIVLSSVNGNIYFLPRENPEDYKKLVLNQEIFEKTGLVKTGILFVNSVKSVYRFESEDKYEKIYESKDHYIWSSLNISGGSIVFLENKPEEGSFVLVSIDTENLTVKKSTPLGISRFLYDCVVVSDRGIYAAFDDKIIKFSRGGEAEHFHETPVPFDTGLCMIALKNHLYFNNSINELYFIDTDVSDLTPKFTGIKCPSINTVAGYEDRLFLGGIDGWSVYKTNGQHVYTFDDIFENRIGFLNRTTLVTMKGNKISFHNMRRYQEADSFTVPVKNPDDELDYFVSSVISDDFVMALTRYGKFFVFTNDKMNIKL